MPYPRRVPPLGRCSLLPRQGEPHDARRDALAQCREKCHRSYCHKHALLFRRSHASDGILDSRDDRIQYHSRHTRRKQTAGQQGTVHVGDKQAFDEVFGPAYAYPGSTGYSRVIPQIFELDPATRLTWAALTYPKCRPLAPQRSALGFYDTMVSLILILP